MADETPTSSMPTTSISTPPATRPDDPIAAVIVSAATLQHMETEMQLLKVLHQLAEQAAVEEPPEAVMLGDAALRFARALSLVRRSWRGGRRG